MSDGHITITRWQTVTQPAVWYSTGSRWGGGGVDGGSRWGGEVVVVAAGGEGGGVGGGGSRWGGGGEEGKLIITRFIHILSQVEKLFFMIYLCLVVIFVLNHFPCMHRHLLFVL